MASASATESLGSVRLEERLERGELLVFPSCPFALPSGEDLALLQRQRCAGLTHKHITYDPIRCRVVGFARQADEPAQARRLREILTRFSCAVTDWLSRTLPAYQGGCEVDRVSFRPDEEATRTLRYNARNDLLHIDAFPGRPARGRRILRFFANLNPSEPRIWATGATLPELLARFGLPEPGWLEQLGTQVWPLLAGPQQQRHLSDWLMLRLHDRLKSDVLFQQRGRCKLWHFPPGSAWMAMTDSCTYAELRGRFALEHSFFIAAEVLCRPDLAPQQLLKAG